MVLIKFNSVTGIILAAAMVVTSAVPLYAEKSVIEKWKGTTDSLDIASGEESGDPDILQGTDDEWEEFDENKWIISSNPSYPNWVYLQKYTGTAEKLVIPETINGKYYELKPVSADLSKDPIFPSCVKALRVEGVMNFDGDITNDIFKNSGIEDLEFKEGPGFIQNWQGEYFKDCKSLKKVVFDLPAGSSRVFTGDRPATSLFEGCTNLETVIFNNVGFMNQNVINKMFKGCSRLKKFYFIKPDFDGYTDIDITSMFEGCSSLERIFTDIKFDQVSFTGNDVFKGCSRLIGGYGRECDGVNNTDYDSFSYDSGLLGSVGYLSTYSSADNDALLDDWIYGISGEYCDIRRYTGSDETLVIPKTVKADGSTKKVRLRLELPSYGEFLTKSVKRLIINGAEAPTVEAMFNDRDLEYAEFNGVYFNDLSYYMFESRARSSYNSPKEVVFKDCTIEGASDLQSFFSGCKSLEKVSFVNTPFPANNNINYMFFDC